MATLFWETIWEQMPHRHKGYWSQTLLISLKSFTKVKDQIIANTLELLRCVSISQIAYISGSTLLAMSQIYFDTVVYQFEWPQIITEFWTLVWTSNSELVSLKWSFVYVQYPQSLPKRIHNIFVMSELIVFLSISSVFMYSSIYLFQRLFSVLFWNLHSWITCGANSQLRCLIRRSPQKLSMEKQ